jgi:hypothetical protein
VILGSVASEERRFVWLARNFQESEVTISSFGSSVSRESGLRERLAVSATRGFGILVRPCSSLSIAGNGQVGYLLGL